MHKWNWNGPEYEQIQFIRLNGYRHSTLENQKKQNKNDPLSFSDCAWILAHKPSTVFNFYACWIF